MHRARLRNLIAAATVAAALLAPPGAAGATSGGTSTTGTGAGTSGTSGSGGASTTPVTPGCPDAQLGKRTLKLGDCGSDVATLNWILTAKDYALPVLDDRFAAATKAAVQSFQRDASLRANGVVGSDTAAALVNAMPPQLATWYGPGFFGNRTACGQTLTKRTLGVAHRTLPCGSKVVLAYNGRFIRTTVIDRGPFANGAKWDLTQATAQALRFAYTDNIRIAKLAE